MVVIEAGGHGVPTVGYHSSGGLQESVVDGVSGVLVDDLDQMTDAVARLLDDADARRAMGEAAVRHAATFEWSASVRGFAGVLARSVRESKRGREDAADLVELLERIQHGTDDHVHTLALPVGADGDSTTPSGPALPREPAPSGLA